jgi:endoglucanase
MILSSPPVPLHRVEERIHPVEEQATDVEGHARGRGAAADLVVLVLLITMACLVASGPVERRGGGAAGTPAAAASGDMVDGTRAAVAQAATWAEQGRTVDAEQVRQIADQPVALWVVAGNDVARQVGEYVDRATWAGRGPLLVLYGIPDRDCGGHSGGGAADAAAYRRYVADVVAGIGGRYATVIVEPDAVPHALSDCQSAAGTEERFGLLGAAISELRASGPVRIYLDAGNPRFVSDVATLAEGLRRAGVQRADGFALNVANFYSTEENVRFGEQVAAELGGTHFVIDTSRNGHGALQPAFPAGIGADGVPVWCNPPGRALGSSPTDLPGPALVDAWLWVKNPGESDGTCRPGEPSAGDWYPDYALGLASRRASATS